jgi:5-methyltetrahydrofolate corrinoid/iron sulfur protein methyltransferase
VIIIGEKINASRPGVKEIIENRDIQGLLALAREQAEAGATYIDVNVGIGTGTKEEEIKSMEWAVETIQNGIETNLCIDSADPKVLKAGIDTRQGRASIINSTKAEEKTLEKVVPLASQAKAPIIALAMDEAGIPKDVQGRLNACRKIVSSCEKHGVSLENVYFDPLVIPVSADAGQGIVTLNTIAGIKEEFPLAKTVVGLSNISYGLPARSMLNAAFLHMAIYAGLDAAIMDPADEGLASAVKAGRALIGKDRHFRRYTKAFRKNN